MTEDEAKEKWCPFVRAVAIESQGGIMDGAPSWNRFAAVPEEAMIQQSCRCIGSACMAWRKATQQVWQRPDGTIINTQIEPHDGRGKWVDSGFCGLAGAGGAP